MLRCHLLKPPGNLEALRRGANEGIINRKSRTAARVYSLSPSCFHLIPSRSGTDPRMGILPLRLRSSIDFPDEVASEKHQEQIKHIE